MHKSSNYLYFNISLILFHSYQNRSGEWFFKKTFAEQNILRALTFPNTIKEWHKLSPEICKSVSHEVFTNLLLKFKGPIPNSLFNISDSLGIKLPTRLRLGLRHLREHKFNHNFQDTINPLCSCSLESESFTHFFCAADPHGSS